jgi:hypothetical protein
MSPDSSIPLRAQKWFHDRRQMSFQDAAGHRDEENPDSDSLNRTQINLAIILPKESKPNRRYFVDYIFPI